MDLSEFADIRLNSIKHAYIMSRGFDPSRCMDNLRSYVEGCLDLSEFADIRLNSIKHAYIMSLVT